MSTRRRGSTTPAGGWNSSAFTTVKVGANATTFTVVNALLFQPPAGVVEPRRLVDIGSSRMQNGFGPSSYPNYLDIRQRSTTVDVYAYSRFPVAMSLGGVG